MFTNWGDTGPLSSVCPVCIITLVYVWSYRDKAGCGFLCLSSPACDLHLLHLDTEPWVSTPNVYRRVNKWMLDWGVVLTPGSLGKWRCYRELGMEEQKAVWSSGTCGHIGCLLRNVHRVEEGSPRLSLLPSVVKNWCFNCFISLVIFMFGNEI